MTSTSLGVVLLVAFVGTGASAALRDTAASLTGTLAFSTSAATTSPVGAYGVTPGGQTSSNYTITYVAGTLDITQAALTVTADADISTVANDHFGSPVSASRAHRTPWPSPL